MLAIPIFCWIEVQEYVRTYRIIILWYEAGAKKRLHIIRWWRAGERRSVRSTENWYASLLLMNESYCTKLADADDSSFAIYDVCAKLSNRPLRVSAHRNCRAC
jgi:hypothetical protein